MRKLFLLVLFVAGCNTPLEMQACANMCSKYGVKALHWNTRCECNSPPGTVEVE